MRDQELKISNEAFMLSIIIATYLLKINTYVDY